MRLGSFCLDSGLQFAVAVDLPAPLAIYKHHQLALFKGGPVFVLGQWGGDDDCHVAAGGCGFNWSMQHNDRLWRKECWHDAKTADLLQRSSEGTDVGSLESWRYLARDRQAV